MTNPTEATTGASFFRPIGNSNQTGSLLTQNNCCRRLVAAVKNIYGSDCCWLAQRILCYVLGTGLIAGGLMILITSVSHMHVVGGFLTAGGVALMGRAVYLEKASYDAENVKYKELKREREALIIRLERQNEVTQSANEEYSSPDQENQQNIVNLDGETAVLTEETEHKREIVESLHQLTDQLDRSMVSILSTTQNNQKTRSDALSEFRSQLEQFQPLVSQLEEESARPFASMLQRFEGFGSVASELAFIEENLGTTQQQLKEREEGIRVLVARYQETEEKLRGEVEELKEAIAFFENKNTENEEALRQQVQRVVAAAHALKEKQEEPNE